MSGHIAHLNVRGAVPADRDTPTVGELGALVRGLAAAQDVADACDVVCDHVAELPGTLMPSIYFHRDGLLRCQTQRGYWQVLDGIAIDTGILASVYRTGTPITIDDMNANVAVLHAVPGLNVETCVPIWVNRRVVGALNVEAEVAFVPGLVEHVASVGDALSSRLGQLWVEHQQTPLERLARTSRELTGLTDEGEIRDALVRLAGYVSGMSSAVLILTTGDGGLRVVAAHGALSTAFHALAPADLARLREMTSQASSWYTHGSPAGRWEPATALLRGAGVVSLAVVPIRGLNDVDPSAVVGFLATADTEHVRIDSEDIEALELLGEEGARCLQLATTVSDLRARASRDALTGLGNHRSFHEALAAAEAGGRLDWAVLLADLDGFKAVNDHFGHLAGDQVLRDLAASLQASVRAGERVFRVGGDEFAVILRTRHLERVAQVAERLLDAASRVLSVHGAGMSVGAALPRAGETYIAVLERADVALYDAKRSEPGSYKVVDR